MTRGAAIVVFAKAPVAGAAKTRLIPALGADGAAALARRLLDRTMREALASGLGPVELCAAPDANHPAIAAWGRVPGVSLALQGDGDLGVRMARALARALARGDRVLLLGTDAPRLDADVLHAAAEALERAPAVFVPAFDGGYALVGLRDALPPIFEHMPWSTPEVMARTRERLHAAGIAHVELPTLHDIDEPADLVHLDGPDIVASTPLADALHAALRDAGSAWAGALIEPLPDAGLAHAHLRLAGTGVLARVPKQSQMDLPAQANLDYQAACFARAATSGHTPRLHGVLPPAPGLPRGALLVEEIVGRPARLPQDLGAIAAALGSIHALPLPAAADRAPLLAPADALALLRGEIDAQAIHFDAAGLDPAARRLIEARRAAFSALCDAPARPPTSLIAFDAHPGNFIVRGDGRAMLVDLEKMRYSHAPLDLAHATLYTSTTWDRASSAVLTGDEVEAFYRTASAAAPQAEALRPWRVPLRAAMWLWSVSWCAKWRVLSAAEASAGGDGEDWSARRSDDALVAHVRERVDHYLSAPVVNTVTAGFDELARRLAG